jgi:hypothetical protein
MVFLLIRFFFTVRPFWLLIVKPLTAQFFLWLGHTLLFLGLAVFFTKIISEHAIGSGNPEMKAILSGKVLSPDTIFCSLNFLCLNFFMFSLFAFFVSLSFYWSFAYVSLFFGRRSSQTIFETKNTFCKMSGSYLCTWLW